MNRIRIVFILLLVSAVCKAEYVPADRAAIVASNFFYSNDENADMVIRKMSLFEGDGQFSTKTYGFTPSYYIFQDENKKGFVIVAADDACNPIVGYSFDSVLPDGPLPDNMKKWLDGIETQISYIREHGVEATEQVRKQWQFSKAGGGEKVLKTAQWNQGPPFNEFCPMDGNQRSITGCVATATAIVMRYNKWPKEGRGETEAYFTSTKGIAVPSKNLNHSYDWDNMPFEYGDSYSKAQSNAVAKLMADIGAAFKADYTSEWTSASYSISSLYRNFNYSFSMKGLSKDDHYYEWSSLIKGEINENRPVLYSGASDANDGHAFVVDGYDGDFFHINWGWGGHGNGFFLLYNLDIDGMSFNDDQWAIIGLKPAGPNDRIENWIQFHRGMYSNESVFNAGVDFNISFDLVNETQIDYSGDVMLAVTDRDGTVKEVLKEYPISISAYGYKQFNLDLTIEGEIKIGDRIRAFYKDDEETEWSLITSDSNRDEWQILVAKEYYLHEITSFEYNHDRKLVKIVSGKDVDVELYDPDGVDITSKAALSDGIVIIGTDDLLEGKYKIVVSDDTESLELYFSIIY